MDASCFDRDLAIFGCYLFHLTVDFNPHDACFDLEILGLKLVEMQQWTARPLGAIDQFS